MRFFANLFLDILLAVFGTAVVEFPIARLIRVRSMDQVVLKEYALSLCCAALLGYFVFRLRQTKSSLWTFLPGVAWIVVAALYIFFGMQGSVLSSPSIALRFSTMFATLSGKSCAETLNTSSCHSWLLGAMPPIRLTAYFAGAAICLKLRHSGSHPLSNAFVGAFARRRVERREMEKDRE